MYISKLKVKGYKNIKEESSIYFNKGLNILVGENGSGKTAIIDSLRLALRENESHSTLSNDDFYCSLDKKEYTDEIKISIDFLGLTENEKITFLTWCDADFNAHLHLQISENPNRRGYFKRKYWGGSSSASIFEEDTFDRIECIYLPPLRDAEKKLANGKRSRLAMLLSKHYGDKTDSLVENVKSFYDEITGNVGGKYNEIVEVKKSINTKIKESLGNELGQSISLQFSEATFSKIIGNMKMMFFPKIGETDITKFRDLSTNSLGYNNLLYIATVLAELELIKDSEVFTVLLIEEPEAHLHPQLQVKFIKYLEELSETLPNAQIIVSTHSPVLASSVSIDKIIHVSQQKTHVETVTLKQKTFGDNISEKYINRWLDVTKSTMLFSRGIILVEGISEALILPKLAVNVLNKYNFEATKNGGKLLANSIEEMGISVININGVNFRYFMKLFCNFNNSSGPNIPIYCAGISDCDPDKDIYPLIGEMVRGKNPVYEYIADINSSKYARLFMSPLKTFEYDLATFNPIIMAKTLNSLWPTDGIVSANLQKIIEKNYHGNDAKYIYEHINDSKIGKGLFAYELAEAIDSEFIVPDYIQKAILWACGGIEKND